MQYLRIQNPWHSPLSDEPEEGLIPCEVVRSSRKTIAIQITAEGRLVLRIPRRASVQSEELVDWSLDGEFGGSQTEVVIENKPREIAIRVPEVTVRG